MKKRKKAVMVSSVFVFVELVSYNGIFYFFLELQKISYNGIGRLNCDVGLRFLNMHLSWHLQHLPALLLKSE